MIVDTSALIDYLRDVAAPHVEALDAAIAADRRPVVPELVRMELLAGPTDDVEVARLQRYLARFDFEPVVPLRDSERAAELSRAARRSGRTIHSMIDCMIAATALRLDLPVLASDRDFEVLASVSPLRLVEP